ncbi:MAG TPA: hypothetical protein VF103_16670 [Polyangiaceae bacterium]
MKSHWLILTLGLAACSGPAEIPATPDLTSVERQYDNPTAVFDPAEARAALDDIPELGQIVSGFRAAGFASRGVNDATDSAKKDSKGAVRIQGSIRVSVRCPGDLGDPVYDANVNGELSLTIGVEESRIKRGIGGRASGCILHGEDAGGLPLRVELDGPFALDLGRDVSIRDHWAGRLLMLVSGTIHVNDLELSNLSARFTDDQFEYLAQVADTGNWFIAIVSDQGVSVRDKDHLWLCPDGQPCGLQ